MKKRAGIRLSLWTIIEGVTILLVILAAFSVVNSFRKNTYFERDFYSKDMALLMDTIQAVPGDVNFVYRIGTITLYTFMFEKDTVTVSDDTGTTDYPIYDNERLADGLSKEKLINPGFLHFTKRRNTMYVDSVGMNQPLAACGERPEISLLHVVYDETSKGLAREIAAGFSPSSIFSTDEFEYMIDSQQKIDKSLLIVLEKSSTGDAIIESSDEAVSCRLKDAMEKSKILVTTARLDEEMPQYSYQVRIRYSDGTGISMGVKNGMQG